MKKNKKEDIDSEKNKLRTHIINSMSMQINESRQVYDPFTGSGSMTVSLYKNKK